MFIYKYNCDYSLLLGWLIAQICTTMADFNIDISTLPEDVREKLAELDLELSEGKWKNTKISIKG